MKRERRYQARLGMETLEDRTLLSVTSTLLDGGSTLRIEGNDLAQVVTLDIDAGAGLLFMSAHNKDLNPQPLDSEPMALIPAVLPSFDLTGVTRLEIFLHGGDDELYITLLNEAGGQRPYEIIIDMGDGNDIVNVDLAGPQFFNLGGPLEPGDDDIQNVFPKPAVPDEMQVTGGSSRELSNPTYVPIPSIPTNTLMRPLFLQIAAGAGQDQVDVRVGSLAEGVSLTIGMDLGRGSDRGEIHLDGMIQRGATMDVLMESASGKNRMAFTTGSQAGVADGAVLQAALLGGRHNDKLEFLFGGELHGNLFAKLYGFAGDDFINARVRTTWNSGGTSHVLVAGQEGNDSLWLLQQVEVPPSDLVFLVPWTPPTTFKHIMNGGPGIDTGVYNGSPIFFGMERLRLWPSALGIGV